MSCKNQVCHGFSFNHGWVLDQQIKKFYLRINIVHSSAFHELFIQQIGMRMYFLLVSLEPLGVSQIVCSNIILVLGEICSSLSFKSTRSEFPAVFSLKFKIIVQLLTMEFNTGLVRKREVVVTLKRAHCSSKCLSLAQWLGFAD